MAKKKKSQNNNSGKPSSKTGDSTKKHAVKERGGLLTFLIAVIFVHAVFATYLAYITLKDEFSKASWVLPVLALTSLAAIAAAVGLWYWKKWAITLYAVVCAIQAGVHLTLTGSLLVVFYDLLPVAILGYVINLQSKQKLFE